jgi:nitric oxide dioxygenase
MLRRDWSSDVCSSDLYVPVGSALLWTLEQGLGDAFTAETREAWATTYRVLAGTMMEAAREIPKAA